MNMPIVQSYKKSYWKVHIILYIPIWTKLELSTNIFYKQAYYIKVYQMQFFLLKPISIMHISRYQNGQILYTKKFEFL